MSCDALRELVDSGEKVSSCIDVGLILLSYSSGHLRLARSIQGFCVNSGTILISNVSTELWLWVMHRMFNTNGYLSFSGSDDDWIYSKIFSDCAQPWLLNLENGSIS